MTLSYSNDRAACGGGQKDKCLSASETLIYTQKWGQHALTDTKGEQTAGVVNNDDVSKRPEENLHTKIKMPSR